MKQRSRFFYLLTLILFSFIVRGTFSEENLRTQKYSSRSAAEATAWQKHLRERLFKLLKMDDLVSHQTEIPFEAQIISSQKQYNYLLQEIEINSTPGRRIHIVVTLPQSKKKSLPAVVCIHGHGGDRNIIYDDQSIYKGFAAALAERGFATIATDVGQHEIFEKNRTLMGERLWDLQRCVDYLEAMPEVDRKRIGCAGLSLGGEMAMWLGAMDERIAATVSAGFLTVMDQMEQNHCLCWKFDGLRELVDFADIYSMIAPRPLMCQNGLLEPETQFYVPLAKKAMKEIRVAYSDFECPEKMLLQIHDGGHEIDLPSLLSFFEDHLH
jgi:hypothetical protein